MTLDLETQIDQPEQAVPELVKPSRTPSLPKVISDKITDDGGTYDTNVKHLLQPGNENDLCTWLKDMRLIRSSMNCPTEGCNEKPLLWRTVRQVDKYGWTCNDCKKRQALRDGSIFQQAKCDLKHCIQMIVAWCMDIPYETVASYLDTKQHFVRKVYEILTQVTEQYVEAHSNEWLLGGVPPNILIVDEFPTGCMTENQIDVPKTKKRNNQNHTVLCITEVSQVPPRMWMRILGTKSEKTLKTQEILKQYGMVEEALNEIGTHSAPGSTLIANRRARYCNYENVKELKGFKVIGIEELQIHDPPEKNELFSNLETIWQTGLGICEDIQSLAQDNAVRDLHEYLWRQRFAKTTAQAFNSILQHITEFYQFSSDSVLSS
ncbi:uncharacterized protein LOC106655769 [Trichogramma pretiosum]|uniref:uncharacterized protein LOC106655769 n=1 Tax=Trichogramma pretiosum TaxID=7493 RepID=UPI0006C98749|nr:uncharacterized protein LOC106655769 [Trichogramma pretiosum]